MIITSAEYKENVSLREQQKEAYEKVLKKIKQEVSQEQILILWNNLPDEKNAKQYLGHSKEWMLYMFGKAARSLPDIYNIYIDSLDTLVDEDVSDPIATVLKRINILHESFGSFPIFLEDNLEPKDYKKCFSVFNTILSKGEPSFDKEGTNRFVHQYFNWQSGKDSVKTCTARLDGVSAPSFYRYISDFEKSPLYPEYLKAYQHVLKDTLKQGNMPDCITFMAAYSQLEGEKTRNENLLKTFPEIAGEIDIPRIKAACDKKIALLKRKGLYKKTLKEHGLESL